MLYLFLEIGDFMIYVVGFILLLLVLVFILFFLKYNSLKDIRQNIEICMASIDEALSERLELVNKLLKDIKNKKIEKSFDYDEKSSIYDREDALFNVSFEINKYVKEKKLKDYTDDISKLNDMEENIDGLKDFYNANVLNYNEIFLKKYFNRIFKLLKFENYKSFKIRKLEEYEIFKN